MTATKMMTFGDDDLHRLERVRRVLAESRATEPERSDNDAIDIAVSRLLREDPTLLAWSATVGPDEAARDAIALIVKADSAGDDTSTLARFKASGSTADDVFGEPSESESTRLERARKIAKRYASANGSLDPIGLSNAIDDLVAEDPWLADRATRGSRADAKNLARALLIKAGATT